MQAIVRRSRSHPHTVQRKLIGLALGIALLSIELMSCSTSPPVSAPPPPVNVPQRPAKADLGPASACEGNGGKYVGDMKYEMSDGSIARILSGADAARAWATSVQVPPGTPRAWVLATTAITFEYNGQRHNTLTGTAATPDGIASGTTLLSQWWGIANRDDLLKTLRWLQFQGHRTEFEDLGRQVDVMTDAQFIWVKAGLQTDVEQLHRLEIVRSNYRALGSKSILAWDLVRYISLCRWGYLAGYLSETEAWDHIMSAALRLQLTFTSWRDLQSDFLIGREFWSMQQTRQTGAPFRAIYDRFILDGASPWNVNDWNMDLHVMDPLPIVDQPPAQPRYK
jgi:hypothetical protein